MPFITQGKTNWKFLIIIILLAIIAYAGVLLYVKSLEKTYQPVKIQIIEKKLTKEKACLNSGGTISTASCFQTASDFPNNCLVGGCGFMPAPWQVTVNIKTCDCGADKCFNGTKCILRQTIKEETPGWQTYRSEAYGFELKYQNDIYFRDDLGGPEWVLKENNYGLLSLYVGYVNDDTFSSTTSASCDNPKYFNIDNNTARKCYFVQCVDFCSNVENNTYSVEILHNKLGYTFLCSDLSHELLCDQIISTFKFID